MPGRELARSGSAPIPMARTLAMVSALQFITSLAIGQSPTVVTASFVSNQPAAIPVAHPGTLMLVGGGTITDELRATFWNLAGKQAARLVLIPSASSHAVPGSETRWISTWSGLAWASVEVAFAPKSGDDWRRVRQQIDQATAVWISGGSQTRLFESFQDYPLEQALSALRARGGIVGGTSAGAAIATQTMIAGGRTEPHIGQGWDLLPGAIVDQHFSQRQRHQRLHKAVSLQPQLVGIGIDESTAVIVRGSQFEVIGRGAAYVCRVEPRADSELLTQRMVSGDRDDWVRWQRLVATPPPVR